MSIYTHSIGNVAYALYVIEYDKCSVLVDLWRHRNQALKSISFKKEAKNQGCTKFAENCPMIECKQNEQNILISSAFLFKDGMNV